jgi:peptidoglycan hydrolase-like protein with peptidoglycan-binding domain
MSVREPSDPALDDWFDEPQPRAGSSAHGAYDGDDWLESANTRPERRPVRPGVAVANRRVLAVVAAAVVILLSALAAAGVFSGSSSTPTATPTTTPTPTSTPTTTPAPAVGPTTTLKPGTKGAQVRALQRALAALGYSPGRIDGSYGPATQKALESFQRASKLTPDGVLGPKTLAALRKAGAPTG